MLPNNRRVIKAIQHRIKRNIKQIKSIRDSLKTDNFHFFLAAFLVFSRNSNQQLYQAFTSNEKSPSKTQEEYKKANYKDTSFLFRKTLATVIEVASFYKIITNSTQREIYDSTTHQNEYEETITNSIINNLPELKKYRDLAELANSLS